MLVLDILFGAVAAATVIIGVDLRHLSSGLHQAMWGDGPRDPSMIPGTPEHTANQAKETE